MSWVIISVAYLQFTEQRKPLSGSSQRSRTLFEQLDSEKLVVQLGGIYALEGVMNTSEPYHQPVLEALSAFVRDSTRNTTGAGPSETDIQAALIVVGRRTPIGTGIPDLAYAHIPQAQLSGAHLSDAILNGAHLSDADLRVANLRSANLGGADLSGADLSSADLSLANLFAATVSQTQFDQACGTDAKLDPGLTLKPCSTSPPGK
jgi:hypothetical protein